jgi:hypothetical protein
MTKGKPWSIDEEKNLKDWVSMGVNLDALVFSFEGKYSKNAIYQKMIDLGLKEEEVPCTESSSSFEVKLPEELPSIEEALKNLSAALISLKQPGLDQTEVFRLRVLISGYKTYKDLLTDYINYRRLEAELKELRAKYAAFLKKSSSSKA